MSTPTRVLAAILTLLLVPVPGSAQDHVVSAADVQARLAAAASEREASLRAVEAALAKGTLSLTEAELRDVAARAERLTDDPVAGTHPVVWVLAGLGVLLVLSLVIVVVECSRTYCY